MSLQHEKGCQKLNKLVAGCWDLCLVFHWNFDLINLLGFSEWASQPAPTQCTIQKIPPEPAAPTTITHHPKNLVLGFFFLGWDETLLRTEFWVYRFSLVFLSFFNFFILFFLFCVALFQVFVTSLFFSSSFFLCFCFFIFFIFYFSYFVSLLRFLWSLCFSFGFKKKVNLYYF